MFQVKSPGISDPLNKCLIEEYRILSILHRKKTAIHGIIKFKKTLPYLKPR